MSNLKFKPYRKYKGCESSQIPELSGMLNVLRGILDDPSLAKEMENKKVGKIPILYFSYASGNFNACKTILILRGGVALFLPTSGIIRTKG